ncbi:MAG: T9SS type A sorting domain-containing protein [Bacteroidia bacterium]|nr:T9SS type A sorting domain-containing protein [Bacteroidota bacterium]MBP9082508.1 T9SS type A sorting domain-containing protein [Bacteroidia bacterium]
MKAALKFGILFLFMCFEAMSQPVTETILFNNYVSPSDNDLVNNFSGSILLTPVSSNGITGGCLTVPTTESWGNNNAIYCSKYMNSSLYSNDARISFKYDSTLINPINYDRAVTIYLNPIADFNHYVIASITYDKKIQIVSYFAANNPFPVNLIHNHWYEFILSTSYDMPIPALYEVTAEAQLNDLGPTGLTPPIPAGNSDIVFTDSLLYVDTAVRVSFSGTAWGGAKYLDNFQFQGIKSADSCNATTGIPAVTNPGVEVFFTANTIECTSTHQELLLELYSISGQKVVTKKLPSGYSSFSVSDFANGLYLMKIMAPDGKVQLTKKFIVSN